MSKESVSTPPKRGFISGVARDTKNILLGAAALPAHLITNPRDIAGKATIVGLSAIPGVGSAVAAAYTFKQSYRETGKAGMSMLKAVGAGIASTVPGVGPAITGMYAVKNIGEQVEREAASDKKGNLSALTNKYSKAKENLVELKKGGIKQNLQKVVANVKTLGTREGWKKIASSARETIGPLTPEQLVKTMEKSTVNPQTPTTITQTPTTTTQTPTTTTQTPTTTTQTPTTTTQTPTTTTQTPTASRPASIITAPRKTPRGDRPPLPSGPAPKSTGQGR